MKKILTLIAITAITFTGCITSEESEDAIGNSNTENTENINNSENNGSSSELIGEWELTETEDGLTMKFTLELKSDGTFSMEGSLVEMGGMVVARQEGTYFVDESAGTMTVEATNCQEMSEDFVLETVDCEQEEDDTADYTTDGSTLTITEDDGDTVFEKQ
jgi:hypothetical protein